MVMPVVPRPSSCQLTIINIERIVKFCGTDTAKRPHKDLKYYRIYTLNFKLFWLIITGLACSSEIHRKIIIYNNDHN